VRADNYLLPSTGECLPSAAAKLSPPNAVRASSELSSANVTRDTKKNWNRKPIYIAVSSFSKNWACLHFHSPPPPILWNGKRMGPASCSILQYPGCSSEQKTKFGHRYEYTYNAGAYDCYQKERIFFLFVGKNSNMQ